MFFHKSNSIQFSNSRIFGKSTNLFQEQLHFCNSEKVQFTRLKFFDMIP